MSGAPYQLLPPLSKDDRGALKTDIAARGVMVPVEYDDEGNVIDGHHRVKICEELGIKDWPRIVRSYPDDAAKRTHARQLNIARRHLDGEARRALIAAELKENAERSDRQIAVGLGVDGKTVATVRAELEDGAEIPHHDKRTGRDGVTQPAAKPSKPTVLAIEVGNERQLPRGALGTGEHEWYTPPLYLDAVREVLGTIDLDPASSDQAQRTVQARRYYTAADDGLQQDWLGRVFLNPPYAQPLIAQFVSKMVREYRAGSVSGVLLTHNYTDTAWFHEAADAADAICFTRGRIRFLDPAGVEASPTQGQAFFYFGPDVARFAARFRSIGLVVGIVDALTEVTEPLRQPAPHLDVGATLFPVTETGPDDLDLETFLLMADEEERRSS